MKRFLINIRGNPLHNTTVELLGTNSGGYNIVKLLERKGAYDVGDVIVVGPGELSELVSTIRM
jgi:hypothetical protein